MPGTRYLLPVLVLLPVAVSWKAERRPAALMVAVQSVLCVLLLLPISSPRTWPAGALWRRMATHRVQSRWWEALGHWLGRSVPPGWTVATGPAGALPYASELPCFDLFGLSTPVGGTRPGGDAGHRAWGLAQALARRVELVYGVEAVPQQLDPETLGPWIVGFSRRYPRLAEGWQPVALFHPPAHHLDVLSDVVWVRRDLLRELSPGP